MRGRGRQAIINWCFKKIQASLGRCKIVKRDGRRCGSGVILGKWLNLSELDFLIYKSGNRILYLRGSLGINWDDVWRCRLHLVGSKHSIMAAIRWTVAAFCENRPTPLFGAISVRLFLSKTSLDVHLTQISPVYKSQEWEPPPCDFYQDSLEGLLLKACDFGPLIDARWWGLGEVNVFESIWCLKV